MQKLSLNARARRLGASGPGGPRLLLFFAIWLAETSGLRAQFTALSRSVQAARQDMLRSLVAVDEAATGPSPGTARAWLAQLGQPRATPSHSMPPGGPPTGYGVAGQPWFVLASASGKVV